MLFSSISFIYFFLPVVMMIYFIMPVRLKNLILLIASLFFYFYGESVYIIVMALSVLSGYIHGLLIGNTGNQKARKLWLISSLIVGGAGLFIFKYADFLIENINRTGLGIPLLKLGLPLGISFYTFQILSYTIDVYRKTVQPQRNLLSFATYVTFFPQLIAGPIVRYSTIAKQLKSRTYSVADISYGLRRMIIGLSKKVLVANILADFGTSFKGSDEKSVLFYWLYYISLTLQLYFDFSAYSDIAIGIGRIFGFRFLENFNYPLTSRSITEFWRRWHISLGSWLRDYIYIPMGGNRVSRRRWVINMIVVWAFAGSWHGAGWNFLAWGIYFAAILAAEKLLLSNFLKRAPRVLTHLYFIVLIIPSFVIFDAATIREITMNLKAMTGFGGIPLIGQDALYYLKSYLVVFMIALIGATQLPVKLYKRAAEHHRYTVIASVIEPAYIVLLLLSSTAYLIDGSFNPFLYFRF